MAATHCPQVVHSLCINRKLTVASPSGAVRVGCPQESERLKYWSGFALTVACYGTAADAATRQANSVIHIPSTRARGPPVRFARRGARQYSGTAAGDPAAWFILAARYSGAAQTASRGRRRRFASIETENVT
ncbi:hypothetical protein GCM10009681_46150 [Luedemannella helvata]|uniref:Uncharacterized protein n=1 Tax=Luedemannella helvata TaxID=349315 RepID=A0ABP4X7E8_9ACTN